MGDLPKKLTLGNRRLPCPRCAEVKSRPRDDALSVRARPDGATLWHCHRCGWSGRERGCPPPGGPRRPEDRRGAEREARARAVWSAARSIRAGDLADRYLRSRGLVPPSDGWPPTLRLGTHEGSAGRAWPCLVAAATRWPGRTPVAAQVTPLREDRGGGATKAWDRPSRLTIGHLAGAAVRLAPWSPGRPIALVEGTEDGIALLAADPTTVPWATLGAANAARAVLPAGCDVVLALDGDDAGRRAAREAAAALWARGHRARVALAPDGADWAALAQRGAGA